MINIFKVLPKLFKEIDFYFYKLKKCYFLCFKGINHDILRQLCCIWYTLFVGYLLCNWKYVFPAWPFKSTEKYVQRNQDNRNNYHDCKYLVSPPKIGYTFMIILSINI